MHECLYVCCDKDLWPPGCSLLNMFMTKNCGLGTQPAELQNKPDFSQVFYFDTSSEAGWPRRHSWRSCNNRSDGAALNKYLEDKNLRQDRIRHDPGRLEYESDGLLAWNKSIKKTQKSRYKSQRRREGSEVSLYPVFMAGLVGCRDLNDTRPSAGLAWRWPVDNIHWAGVYVLCGRDMYTWWHGCVWGALQCNPCPAMTCHGDFGASDSWTTLHCCDHARPPRGVPLRDNLPRRDM